MKIMAKLAALGVAMLTATVAVAQEGPTVDTAEIVAYINDEMIVGLAAVGAVVILAAVVAVSYKWIKGMLFG